MSFPYTRGIPNPPVDPSVDAPNMQTNTNSIDDWTSVDHIGFNQSLGGQHSQVTLPANSSPGSQTGLASVGYTTPGVANSAASQLAYKNSLGTFFLSTVRAYGFCNSAGVQASQSFGVTSVVRNAVGNYTVTLNANAVSSNKFGVIVSSDMSSNFLTGTIPGYLITGVGTFKLNFKSLTAAAGIDPTDFTFIVFQI